MSGYTKLFSSILASTVWREPKHVRIVWITMLAMADKYGVVEASVPGLADFARVSLDECNEALQRLQSPDTYSRTKDNEGRRIGAIDGGWEILNHAKYREKMSAEDRREYNRIKQQESRARQQTSNNVKEVLTGEHNQHIAAPSPSPEALNATHTHPPESSLRPFSRSPSDPDVQPKSLDEVIGAGAAIAATKEQCEAFWNHYESTGWIDKHGNVVRKWRNRLASWVSSDRGRTAEKAHHGGSRASGPSESMQLMIADKELVRVEKRITEIQNSVEGMQTLDMTDRDELRDLKKRRTELKKQLGFKA